MGDNLKKLAKSRLLEEMLGSVKASGGADWSVLIMDGVTTKVMSSNCRISEILDYGISLVDNVAKRREPLPSLSGVYFITPSNESVRQVIEDFKEKPLYKTAHIFFSSAADPRQLNAIKNSPNLMAHLKTLKEVNLEFLTVDRRTFVTDEDKSLQVLFGESGDAASASQAEVQTIARRLVTLFASLKEFPAIRFRAAKPPGDDVGSGLESRQLISQRIAVEVNDRLMPLQRAGVLPADETCDFIVIDRGFDVVAPIIHEWTYEAMVYDLLKLEGNVFQYQSETQGGRSEAKEHLLDERDELWLKLRHEHFASAASQITRNLDEFRSKHKAANYKGAGDGTGLDMRGMRSLVQSLPQYREQLARLSVHVEIASSLNKLIDGRRLVDLGKLEQDLVFGDATSKEVITFLSTFQDLNTEDKVRLLMSYVATHPEKLDSTKQVQWQKLAKLTNDDMATVINLECLGVPVRKRGKSSGLNFGRKRKRAVRKDREPGQGEQEYELSRFVPMLQEVLEDVAENKLGVDEYPYVRPPSSPPTGSGNMSAAGSFGSVKGASVRSNKTTVGWAKKAIGAGKDDVAQPKGRRVIVFIVGGVSRSEMRAVHKLSTRLGREFLLGGTSIINPATFMKGLKALSADVATLELDFK